jgi:hypothetical protein
MRSSLATSEPSMEKSSEAKRVQVRLGWLDFLLGQALQQEQQRLQEKLKQLHEAQQERQQAAPLWRKW